MTAVTLLQLGSAILINASFAWMTGAWLSRFWLQSSHRAYDGLDNIVATSSLIAAGLCLLGSGAALWAATAVMSGASLAQATDMLMLVASDTALGHSSVQGMAMLLAIVGVGLIARRLPKSSPACDLIVAALLLGFAFSRASVSHAAENGLLSIGFAVEWLHLALVASWMGAVALAGWVVLPFAQRIPAAPDYSRNLSGYLASLSQAAGLALAGIVATGLYNSWQRLGEFDKLFGNAYGNALTVKVALVLLAVALGGYNKWIGFASISTATSTQALARVSAILRVEAWLLLAALSAAAVLVSQAPPASF
ncbi:MAG: putative copper resistance protein D [Janthinobacterium sp.]|jgi:putative copper resistance protein D